MPRGGGVAHWVLYVDETGRFDGDDLSLVVGVLLAGGRDRSGESRLRAALASIFPPVAWPPHAWELAHPSSRVHGALHAATWDEPPGVVEERRRLAPLVRLVKRSGDPALDGLRRPTGDRRSLLTSANTALRSLEPGEFLSLEHRCDEQQQAATRFLAGLAERAGPGGATVVAAEAGDPGDSVGLPPPLAPGLYVEALTVLFERVFRLVATPERASVEAVVLRTNVDMPGTHAPRRPLGVPLLQKIAARAQARVGISSAGLNVSVSNPGWDDGTPAGCVVADLVAWRLRAAIRSATYARATATWRSFDGWVAQAGRLGVGEHRLRTELLPRGCARAGPLPAFTRTGSAEAGIRDAWRGLAVLPGAPSDWADDQAGRWRASFDLPWGRA